MTTDRAPRPQAALAPIRRPSTPGHWCQAAGLLWCYVQWIREVSGLDPLTEQPSFRAEIDALEATYRQPDADLFIAIDSTIVDRPEVDGGVQVIGTVALRHHHDGSSELKRLYVDPQHRGQGLAGRLVTVAVAEAARHGSQAIWLETVQGFMDPAIALYRRHGFAAQDRPGATFHVPSMLMMAKGLHPGAP